MKDIFIKQIDCDENGPIIRRRYRVNGNPLVFSCQGNKDSACSIYSLLSCLALIKQFEYDDNDRVLELDRRTCKFKLLHYLFHEKRGMNHFMNDGFYLKSLSGLVNKKMKTKVKAKPEENRTKFEKFISDYIDKDYPVMIGFARKDESGHAVAVVGYEKSGEEIKGLYCLDPAFPPVGNQCWNNFISVELSDNKKKFPDYNENEDKPVIVDSIIGFAPK